MTERTEAVVDVDRVRTFLETLDRLTVDDLAVLALAEPDETERAEILGRAKIAAEGAGRGDEFRAAPMRAREALVQAFSFRGYDPTWFGLNWGRSLGRADDRARLVAAVEDAAVAAVVADLLPEDDVIVLREPFEHVAAMAGTAPSASPAIAGTPGRRGLVAAAFIVGALVTASLSGLPTVIAALAARRHRPPPDN